jgi:hypothetical protein
MNLRIKFTEKQNNATVEITGNQFYYATETKGFFVKKIALFRSSDKQLILECSVKAIPPRFKIIFPDKTETLFKPETLQALNYIFIKDGTRYDVYQHKDRKHSVFCNNVQIAYFDKDEISKFGADSYTIEADNDADKEILLGFLLILHLLNGSDKRAIYSKDIGNIWEKKAFDPTWTPK